MTEKRFKLDDFDSEVEMLELINTQSEIISDLEKKNEQIIREKERYRTLRSISCEQIDNTILTIENFVKECSDNKVKKALNKLLWTEVQEYNVSAKNRALIDENEQLKQQLEYIQNSISEHIKHQKTELGQKALQEIIEDYNEWLLGHKRDLND